MFTHWSLLICTTVQVKHFSKYGLPDDSDDDDDVDMLPKQPPVARQPLEQLAQQQQQENVNKAAGQQVSCIKSLSSRWFCWLMSQSFAVSSVLWCGWSTGRASDLSKSAPVIPKCFCFWRDPAQRRATSEMKATHTQPFYCLFGTTQVSRCQKKSCSGFIVQGRYQRQTHQQFGWAPLHEC